MTNTRNQSKKGSASQNPRYNCVSPSCGHEAEQGSHYCNAHNGEAIAWYLITRDDGSKVNIRASSLEAAQKAAPAAPAPVNGNWDAPEGAEARIRAEGPSEYPWPDEPKPSAAPEAVRTIHWNCPKCSYLNIDLLGETAVPTCEGCMSSVEWSQIQEAAQ